MEAGKLEALSERLRGQRDVLEDLAAALQSRVLAKVVRELTSITNELDELYDEQTAEKEGG